jgi:ectoine hydroxylase-related dioxygenase (phytanoyl-CoA dioxygenase family)
MDPVQKRDLDVSGYAVFEDFMSQDLLSRIRDRVEELFEAEGDSAGSEFRMEEQTRRLANLVDKGEVFWEPILMPEILECVEFVLGPEFKLSSLNVRSANPNSTWTQPLHADTGAVKDESGYSVCNTVWMLDDFTLENGALRVVPGSHQWGRLPQDILAEPQAVHPDEILLTGRAGTVVVMNAHAWHGGTANRTSLQRRAMHGFYCRRDKPQQQYQKRLLRLEVQAKLSPELRNLLALDDPMNDELSSLGSNRSGFLK